MQAKIKQIQCSLDKRIGYLEGCKEIARKGAAYLALKYMRMELGKHNMNRHHVKIVAAMGTAFITVNDRILYECDFIEYCRATKKIPPIVETLNMIQSIVEENYEWAWHLDDEMLV